MFCSRFTILCHVCKIVCRLRAAVNVGLISCSSLISGITVIYHLLPENRCLIQFVQFYSLGRREKKNMTPITPSLMEADVDSRKLKKKQKQNKTRVWYILSLNYHNPILKFYLGFQVSWMNLRVIHPAIFLGLAHLNFPTRIRCSQRVLDWVSEDLVPCIGFASIFRCDLERLISPYSPISNVLTSPIFSFKTKRVGQPHLHL